MKRLLLNITALVFACHSFGQDVKDNVYERVYVQTDKQLYLAGETVFIKMTTFDSNFIPISFSKAGYAELVDETATRIQIKVMMTHGTGGGRMILPADLPSGSYRLIAYTQYMRNEGVDVFFEKSISVINTFQSGYYPQTSSALSVHSPLPEKEKLSSQVSNDGISLQADKTVYAIRGHGELTVSGLPDSLHTLCVSIAGKDPAGFNETSLRTAHKNMPTTTGVFSGEFLPEYEGLTVSGKLIDNRTEKIVRGDMTILAGLSIPGQVIRFFPGQITPTGDIRFITSGVSAFKDIATVVYNKNDDYRIDIVSPFVTRFAPKRQPVLYIDSTYYERLLARSVALQVSRYFSDDPVEQGLHAESTFKIKPTHTYLLDEYTRFQTMHEVFIEIVENARFRRINGKWELSIAIRQGANINYESNPLVFLDGTPISNHELIHDYNPFLVKSIHTYNRHCNFGGHTFAGIIEIKTYQGLLQDINLGKSTQIIPYEGPQSSKIFLTQPAAPNRNNRLPDTRHTLLWNPEVQTEGKSSLHIPFETSDLTGEYQVTVEGLTKDGKVIYATCFFNVE